RSQTRRHDVARRARLDAAPHGRPRRPDCRRGRRRPQSGPGGRMSDRTIYPTRTCFDDTVEFLERAAREHPEQVRSGRFSIVHGIIRIPDDQAPGYGGAPGARSVHAWIEDGPRVWEHGILDGQKITYCVDRREYYAKLRVQETTVYPPQAVLTNNLAFGTT